MIIGSSVYSLVRATMSAVVFIVAFFAMKKLKLFTERKKLLIFATLVIWLVFSLSVEFIPFENLFVSFKSPEAAYHYYCGVKSSVELIVEGEDCDLIVGKKKGGLTELLIPKTSDGWKVGIYTNKKLKYYGSFDGVWIRVYQFKNSNDYYILVHASARGEVTIADSYGTEFYPVGGARLQPEKSFFYYGYIANFDTQYTLTVNGDTIVCDEENNLIRKGFFW